MALTKRIGFGCTLGCDPLNGTSYTVLAAITKGFDGPDVKTDEVNTAALADNYATFAGGQKVPGKVSFQILYDPLDTATTTVLTGLLSSSAVAAWQIKFPVIASETQQVEAFHGFVSGFKRTIEKATAVIADVEITVSGAPGYTGE